MNAAFLDALHANPWTESLVDLPALNQAASTLIEDRVRHLRATARAGLDQLRSESLVLLGPPGTGKTHLFSRARKSLGPRAVFVHIRPLLHAGLTPSYVLGEVVSQLARPSFGRKEWQVDAMVGSLIGHLEGGGGDFPIAHLSTFLDLQQSERSRQLESLTNDLLELFPDLDDVFVERLLALPFAAQRQRRALLAWLTGRDCDPSQLARIGAATSMTPDNAVRALRTLTSVSALGAPIVLVFDQLENLIEGEAAEPRIIQYGNLVAELIDSTRGLLVVQMALDSEWQQGIEPRFNLSQRSRVVMKKVSMALPTPPQSHSLLQLWQRQLKAPERPFPWPLSADQLRELTTLPGITPRMLLAAFKEAHEGFRPSVLPSRQQDDKGLNGESLSSEASATSASEDTLKDAEDEVRGVLAEEWHARLVAAHRQIDEAENHRTGLDVDRLCDGVLVATRFAPARAWRGTSDPFVQLEPTEPGGRWLCFLTQGHYRSMGAALERVLARGLNEPGVLLREQWRPVLSTWKATQAQLSQVLARPHVAWHDLGREEAASLLALGEILQAARSRDLCDPRGAPLTEAQVQSYLREEVHPERWPLLERLGLERREDPETSGGGHTTAPNDRLNPPLAHDAAAAVGNGSVASREQKARSCTAEVQSTLRRLRVASVDRLVREVHRVQPQAGRAEVLAELNLKTDNVVWFGRNIVAWREES